MKIEVWINCYDQLNRQIWHIEINNLKVKFFNVIVLLERGVKTLYLLEYFLKTCLVRTKMNLSLLADINIKFIIKTQEDEQKAWAVELPFCHPTKQKECYPVQDIKLFNDLDDGTKNLPLKEF